MKTRIKAALSGLVVLWFSATILLPPSLARPILDIGMYVAGVSAALFGLLLLVTALWPNLGRRDAGRSQSDAPIRVNGSP